MPTFATPQSITVTVDVACGGVMVIASDRTDTVVEVRPTDASKKNDVRGAEQVRVDYAAGTLTVKTPKGWRSHTPFGGQPASIELTIEVPTGSRLNATAGLGTILGAGELGECDLRLISGDITVERPLGSVTAKNTNGNIRIGDAARGELRLETSVGELEVGIRPGAAALVETNTAYGTVQNQMQPVDLPRDNAGTVHVYARNSYGDIIIRHAIAA
ncbi:DUF4097 domain-containing protein [Nocardia iowensis]|uniref:DUF4097 domain-containing protein n=1 Tax=Nocardia iowensis TaxID=204891 RepID=A0ABX8RXN7_NOCIO|nr:DUF4097 domain-containing protein [Nocardia iowensis]QXN94435.1 DUF4097 domain-containing protein [Nocardia iowensis]